MIDPTMQGLLDELNVGMADVVEAIQEGNGNAAAMCKELIQAVTAAAPRIMVSPTPIQNVIEPARNDWVFDFTYDDNNNGRLKSMRARRI